MQYYYGDKMALRILDEAEFWKRQEQEHTIVIRQLVPDLETEFVQQLEDFEQAFSQTEGLIVRYIETLVRTNYQLNPLVQQNIWQLVDYSLKQSQQFIFLLNQIASQSTAVINNQTAQVVINHIRRESEYFIGIGQVSLYQ